MIDAFFSGLSFVAWIGGFLLGFLGLAALLFVGLYVLDYWMVKP